MSQFTQFDSFHSRLMSVTAEVEAAEAAIRQKVRAAAEAGDCHRVIQIIDGWDNRPVTDVLSECSRPDDSPTARPQPGLPLD